ncbi:hypothetical protein GCM10010121_031990 [Streptomyces brasiliensis]|uniref:UDP-glucose 4-epimerase n=1 Tax=Streptomyces brasiliensis TaxID=1954 RepID=A0A917NQ56_9ACTN|nr:NAD-dependent epimerase/dehydratase family protein [Streptomyces brasiliensis]GGJ18635.1 hypothetical protein GCM10010121_031990 [Streptomyces brasiliensis]
MSWLITGGAGYIGAHVVRAMTKADERAVVYDDLSTGIAERVPDGVPLVVGSTLDGDRVAPIDRINAITGYDRAPTATPRRPGDPARVVASADRIATELGWKARHDLEDMITSAWAGWLRRHPEAARS